MRTELCDFFKSYIFLAFFLFIVYCHFTAIETVTQLNFITGYIASYLNFNKYTAMFIGVYVLILYITLKVKSLVIYLLVSLFMSFYLNILSKMRRSVSLYGWPSGLSGRHAAYIISYQSLKSVKPFLRLADTNRTDRKN